jgi:hypothetical protein
LSSPPEREVDALRAALSRSETIAHVHSPRELTEF